LKPLVSVAGLGGALWLGLFAIASAGPLEDGQSAYARGAYGEAVRLWRPLAERGSPRAQCLMGLSYSLGRGVPQDYSKAAYWYRKAAQQGDSEARINLGAMYAEGLSVPQDYAEAIRLWSMASD
jgi:uncharacterized protein